MPSASSATRYASWPSEIDGLSVMASSQTQGSLGAVNNSLPPLAKMAATFAISLSWTSALRRKKSPTQPRHQRFGRRKLSILRRRTEPGLLGSSLEIPRSCWLRHPLHTRCNHVQSRLGKLVCPSTSQVEHRCTGRQQLRPFRNDRNSHA